MKNRLKNGPRLRQLIGPEQQKKLRDSCKELIETIDNEDGMLVDMAMKLLMCLINPKALTMMPPTFIDCVLTLAVSKLIESALQIENDNIAESN